MVGGACFSFSITPPRPPSPSSSQSSSPKTMAVHLGPLRSGAPCPSPPPPTTSPDVSLAVAGGELVAVARLAVQYATPAAVAAAVSTLKGELAADGLALAGEAAGGGFRVAQYGPLFTMEARTNEVMLTVSAGG